MWLFQINVLSFKKKIEYDKIYFPKYDIRGKYKCHKVDNWLRRSGHSPLLTKAISHKIVFHKVTLQKPMWNTLIVPAK